MLSPQALGSAASRVPGGAVVAVLWLLALLAIDVRVRAQAPPGSAPSLEASSRAPSGEPAQALEGWISKLTGADPAERQAAVAAIDTADIGLLPAISARLSALERGADHATTAAVIAAARSRILARAGGDRAKVNESKLLDTFERLMAAPRPLDADWRNVATALFLARMLTRIGTTTAARDVVSLYEGFGEPVRPDIERQVKIFGERAVPALIELRRAEARELRPLAVKLLEMLGKSVPGEAVQTADNALLADVLRAYGRIKDADAARVIVEFANSDRTQVREAAREAAMMLGEACLFQLRESYEALVGKKPPTDWAWDKVAKELFVAYDRARLAELYTLLDQGLAAYRSGQLDAMASAFDRVLARAPSFERRAEMVPGWLAFARALRTTDRAAAMAVLRKALRIDPAGDGAQKAESELLYLEAVDWAHHGVVDETAYRRALELDPSNADAKTALEGLQAARRARSATAWRYVVAFVAVLAAAVAVVARRRAATAR
jgi:hypothetical protein